MSFWSQEGTFHDVGLSPTDAYEKTTVNPRERDGQPELRLALFPSELFWKNCQTLFRHYPQFMQIHFVHTFQNGRGWDSSCLCGPF